METHSYNHDTTVPQIRQQNQSYEGWSVTERANQQRPPGLRNQKPQQQSSVDQKPKPPERMPKARALALVRLFKQWLVIASLVSFGTFSGLAAFHQIDTTTTANRTSSASSQTTSATSSSANGFLNQQGGNKFGSSNSSQAPVSGSSVS